MEKNFLIDRWLQDCTDTVATIDDASLSVVRERVRDAGRRAQLDATLIETVAIVATELARNQLRYAKHARMGVRCLERNGVAGIEIVAADRGPGIADPAGALMGRTGQSAAATTLGAGLASVRHLADEVDFDIRVGEGACVWARKYAQPVDSPCREVALYGRTCPGESISGDDAIFYRTGTEFVAALADGLGHGRLAREASAAAMSLFDIAAAPSLPELFRRTDQALADTRGAAMGAVRFDAAAKTVAFGAAGDIGCHMYRLKHAHYFAATPYMLGHTEQQQREIRIETEPADAGAVLVLFSDGLKTGVTLKEQLEILRRPVAAIAQYLVQTFGRNNDDAMVLVARLGRK